MSRLTRAEIVARIEAHPLGDTATEQRPRFDALMAGPGLPPVAMAPVVTRRGAATIIHFHGGGYAFGSNRSHSRFARELAVATGCPVALPAYPLAPEHRWPAQLEAALAVCAGQVGRFILSGDSAGGHLALVTALELARRSQPVPEALLLASPNTDRTGRSDTRTTNDPLDPMVDDAGDCELARQCFGDMADDHVHVSPLLDNLSVLPPVYLEAGSQEVLLGDARLLAQAIAAAGGTCDFHELPAGLHMGPLWAPWWDEANASLARMAQFCATHGG